MGAFAQAQTCRRLVLLNYFGENRQTPCGNCDICLDPPKQYDGLVEAQQALSCIYRAGQRFGLGYIVDVLRGSNNQRIREYGHDKLAVYGIGKDKSQEHWVSVLRQLIHLGLITQNIANYSALQLTESARRFCAAKCRCNSRYRGSRISSRVRLPAVTAVITTKTVRKTAQIAQIHCG